METNKDCKKVFNLKLIIQKIWQQRKLFYVSLPVVFIISCAIVLCIPRYFRSTVMLAPEIQGAGLNSGLGSLASSLGYDLNNLNSEDAFYPDLYPQIVASNEFCLKLAEQPVHVSETGETMSYFDYLAYHQKYPFWKYPKMWIEGIVHKLKKSDFSLPDCGENSQSNMWLSEAQISVIQGVRASVSCEVDARTSVISITATAQDRQVCAEVADAVQSLLQDYIISYRTTKIRNDVSYYEQQMETSLTKYEGATKAYVEFIDSHNGLQLERYRIQAKNLEDEQSLQYSIYTSFYKQYLSAISRLQERTPSFTPIENSFVPIKPAGPKRMMFVAFMLFLACFVICCYISKEEIKILISYL